MELIKNEKLRLLTLKRRNEGLEKKLDQHTTLYDVSACMIICDPATNSTSFWPDDSAQVHSLIDSYKANPSGVRAYIVFDFISKQQKNADEEVVKPQKKNMESK
ncbi:hypothetical protein AAHA92_17834 [Salvia divinorum]|uniref:MADS-box domain-containing protein n=1 Tax=Salvia divinorum TaxID=28513 RepID=A0ABD1H035_SALDI